MPRSCHFYNLEECFSPRTFPKSWFPTFPDLQKAWRDVERGVSYLGRDVNHHSVCLC